MIDVGTVLTGLSALVIAIGTVMTQRSRRIGLDVRVLKSDLKRRTRQFQVALRHVGRLEDHLARVNKEPPARPAELDPDWGLEDEEDDGPPDEPRAVRNAS